MVQLDVRGDGLADEMREQPRDSHRVVDESVDILLHAAVCKQPYQDLYKLRHLLPMAGYGCADGLGSYLSFLDADIQ